VHLIIKGGDCNSSISWGYKFYFSTEKNVYFNSRGEGSVIQTSFRGWKCNLLYFNWSHVEFHFGLPDAEERLNICQKNQITI